MKIETKQQLILSTQEYLAINNALDILHDMAKDSQIRYIVNNQLPCGFNIEDIRDGLQYITDIVQV